MKASNNAFSTDTSILFAFPSQIVYGCAGAAFLKKIYSSLLFKKMNGDKRTLFTQAMSCTETLAILTPEGVKRIEIDNMATFLSAYFDGFCSKWEKFVKPSSDPRARCHKSLEQADLREDSIYFNHLIHGKTKHDDRIDRDQIEFLQYYARNAQVCWKLICNAPGCVKPATKTCAKCHTARYCSRSCQLTDWKSGHKSTCESLIGWDSCAKISASVIVMVSLCYF